MWVGGLGLFSSHTIYWQTGAVQADLGYALLKGAEKLFMHEKIMPHEIFVLWKSGLMVEISGLICFIYLNEIDEIILLHSWLSSKNKKMLGTKNKVWEELILISWYKITKVLSVCCDILVTNQWYLKPRNNVIV